MKDLTFDTNHQLFRVVVIVILNHVMLIILLNLKRDPFEDLDMNL